MRPLHRQKRCINKGGLLASLFVACLLLIGCGQEEAGVVLPEEGPEVVVKRFYDYISEAKLKGGASPAREAFKLIDSERSQLRVEQFLQVIKKYPPGFKAEVGEGKIEGASALVQISYKMPSIFDEGFTVTAEVPLTVHAQSNSWKIDFTGETYGMDRSQVLKEAGVQEEGVAQKVSENEKSVN